MRRRKQPCVTRKNRMNPTRVPANSLSRIRPIFFWHGVPALAGTAFPFRTHKNIQRHLFATASPPEGGTPCNNPEDYAFRLGLRRRKQPWVTRKISHDRVGIAGLRLLSLPHHRTCGFPHPAVERSGLLTWWPQGLMEPGTRVVGVGHC